MKIGKIIKVIELGAALSGLSVITSCGTIHNFTIVKDFLVEMPTYTSVDYKYAQKWFKWHPISAGGCSAVVKNVGDQNNNHLIIGRNMDYAYSKKCAYIIRTEEPDKYKTLGFAYATNPTSPDFEKVQKYGISNEWYRIAPFFCTDVINEEGLYCEIDMRNIEKDDKGKSKFRCSGTNPETHVDVHMVALTRFIVSNCKNVTEAIKYVQDNINVFNKEEDWNFSFLLADAEGKYGLLEFGHNDIFWKLGQNCQTNYFVNDTIKDESKIKFGIGRYQYLQDHLNDVTDTDTMFNLINQIRYSNVYYGKNCPFDMRSETSDFLTDVPYEWLMPWYTEQDHPEEVKQVYEKINKKLEELWKLPEEERKKLPWYWQSTFTEIVDIPSKTIHIRMFEDDDYIFDYTV